MEKNDAFTAVVAPNAEPRAYLVFLHGILGSRANWRTFVRSLVESCPGWGALLVDLRLHGELSDAAYAPPHTVEAAADDVVELLRVNGFHAGALVGHSFGGKVATHVASRLPRDRVRQLWLLDSPPGARESGDGSESTLTVLRELRRLPPIFATRGEFIRRLEERGISKSVAQWLAMNLVARADQSYSFALDVVSISAMLDDFFALDTWPLIETLASSSQWKVELVVGGKSDVFIAREREKLSRFAASGRGQAHVLENAGHWVHVDAPQALRACMQTHILDP